MPGNIAHASASTRSTARLLAGERTSATAVCQSHNFAFASQIPYDSVTGATSTCKDRLHLLIPGYGSDFVELGAPRPWSWRVWFAWVFQIPDGDLGTISAKSGQQADTYLASNTTGGEKIGRNGIKFETADRSSVSTFA